MPVESRVRRPEESLRGESLLATQTTVCFETLWYHIPRYLRIGFWSGEKKPRSKVWELERKTSPSLRDLFFRSVLESECFVVNSLVQDEFAVIPVQSEDFTNLQEGMAVSQVEREGNESTTPLEATEKVIRGRMSSRWSA
ncbi:hypothetical protein LINPERHAP1_LOCUS13662 [Linum perenne]